MDLPSLIIPWTDFLIARAELNTDLDGRLGLCGRLYQCAQALVGQGSALTLPGDFLWSGAIELGIPRASRASDQPARSNSKT
jgi:hypothetical protein